MTTAAIWYLLKTNSAVLAVVPATRIVCGDLPLNTTLPAISVKQISSVPVNLINTNEANKQYTDRVQVTALYKGTTGGYPSIKALMRLILAACPSQRGTVNGVALTYIQPESEGPDLYDQELDIYSQSRDFLVRWTA
ncbi:tail completion protein gp17 [Propionivibrio sp.]|uniref:tail completion protein gp17 n=1 Tax=Propionivibrio sp. TaxID=2212460 RepID=UPI003BF41EEA